jgi:hypothetical protein
VLSDRRMTSTKLVLFESALKVNISCSIAT